MSLIFYLEVRQKRYGNFVKFHIRCVGRKKNLLVNALKIGLVCLFVCRSLTLGAHIDLLGLVHASIDLGRCWHRFHHDHVLGGEQNSVFVVGALFSMELIRRRS